jgi:hypothetical protein
LLARAILAAFYPPRANQMTARAFVAIILAIVAIAMLENEDGAFHDHSWTQQHWINAAQSARESFARAVSLDCLLQLIGAKSGPRQAQAQGSDGESEIDPDLSVY